MSNERCAECALIAIMISTSTNVSYFLRAYHAKFHMLNRIPYHHAQVVLQFIVNQSRSQTMLIGEHLIPNI